MEQRHPNIQPNLCPKISLHLNKKTYYLFIKNLCGILFEKNSSTFIVILPLKYFSLQILRNLYTALFSLPLTLLLSVVGNSAKNCSYTFQYSLLHHYGEPCISETIHHSSIKKLRISLLLVTLSCYSSVHRRLIKKHYLLCKHNITLSSQSSFITNPISKLYNTFGHSVALALLGHFSLHRNPFSGAQKQTSAESSFVQADFPLILL